MRSLDAEPPDLVLLDLGLPDGDGSEVAIHAAREHPTIPVIVLTARDSEVDVVLSLEAGAVDYVTKPFRLAELLARIASHLRMRDALVHTRPGSSAANQAIDLGDLTVDVAARRVILDGTEIALRPKEFDVIRVLAEAAGVVVTRERLIEDVWDENWWGSTKTLDVHINSIRRKLGEEAGAPSRITTIRGVGYRLETRATEHVRRRVLAAVLLTTTLAVVAFFVPAALAIRNSQRRGDLLELQREASIVANRVANAPGRRRRRTAGDPRCPPSAGDLLDRRAATGRQRTGDPRPDRRVGSQRQLRRGLRRRRPRRRRTRRARPPPTRRSS